MQNSDIATMVLCAIGLSVTGYLAYLSWRIKRLDRQIDFHAEALEASRRSAQSSPAE
jgi:hypothetical protein